MARWVESRIESQDEDLLDSSLKPVAAREQSSMFEVLDLGLECTRTAAAERPSSRKVSEVLVQICSRVRRAGHGKNIIV
ncbi:uncharacterized protein A4U43_C07F38340 [Asparagus officinalis]|uniref:Serine-threonine/tyrosine-protein kinase catalytic domain-containing protein n=2 Tax=Asparagus officinalis TaxID=4686 RepID=A0A5P1EL97_ASPOF|nr:uncharacterized protein A4U43_C07F38340 [Asparagus officinalis]